MVSDAQVRLLRQKRMEGKTQEAAAAAAGMSGHVRPLGLPGRGRGRPDEPADAACTWAGALIGADLVLAAATRTVVVFVGVALWGLHMGLTQGLLATLVAATAPADLRGTAFGLFNLASGVVLLLASVVAGLLWSRLGPSATFLAGAIFTAIAMAGLVLMSPERQSLPPAGDVLQGAARSSSRQHTW